MSSAALRHEFQGKWQRVVGHRFVTEIIHGTLNDAVLQKYLFQDYCFVEDFYTLLGQAVASTDALSAKLAFARQLGFIASQEDSYFIASLSQLGVPADTLQNNLLHPVLMPAAERFRALIRRTVATRSYAHILVLLVVAEWVYLDSASRAYKELAGTLPDRPEHRGWITLHEGDAFREWVGFLRREFDRVVDVHDHSLRDLFATALDLECAFFSDSYGGGVETGG